MFDPLHHPHQRSDSWMPFSKSTFTAHPERVVAAQATSLQDAEVAARRVRLHPREPEVGWLVLSSARPDDRPYLLVASAVPSVDRGKVVSRSGRTGRSGVGGSPKGLRLLDVIPTRRSRA
jgi:hypothetical protein